MPIYKVFMEYNRPMYGEFYLGVKRGVELDDFVIENFLHWNIECLDLEEDFHTDHTYEIDEVQDDSNLDIWWIDEAGEQIERPIEIEPMPEATQLELF